MSKHVSLKFELTEWAADGDLVIRRVRLESNDRWQNLNAEGVGFLPHEIMGFLRILDGLRQIAQEVPDVV